MLFFSQGLPQNVTITPIYLIQRNSKNKYSKNKYSKNKYLKIILIKRLIYYVLITKQV